MKLVVAFCTLAPATVRAVEKYDPIFADTSRSYHDYFSLLKEMWTEGEAFVLLEQDKVPKRGALEAIYDCPEQWCSYPVPMAHNGEDAKFPTLSCTKFGQELMDKYPDLMDRVGETDMGYGLKHWNRLDMSVALWIGRKHGPVHWHPTGMVGHEHAEG